MLRATLTYVFLGSYIAVATPVGLLWHLLSGNSDFLYWLARLCVRTAGWICGVRVEAHGRERIRSGQPYLFLSNHQGNLDGPALFYATGRNLRALIKKEIMRIPILSSVLRAADFVPIDRSDALKARAGIDRASRLLKNGISFFAFPEGTRSRTGKLGEFKKGVFVMAINAGVPVIPVTICNSRAIQPPDCYAITPGTIRVIFHEPIPTDQMKVDDRVQLLNLTRASIARELADTGTSP